MSRANTIPVYLREASDDSEGGVFAGHWTPQQIPALVEFVARHGLGWAGPVGGEACAVASQLVVEDDFRFEIVFEAV